MKEKILTRKRIYLRDTDATGVLYFTEQQRMALEVLEERLSLCTLLEKENFLMPIVHVEADYKAPLKVGDVVDISCEVVHLGTTSLTFAYTFFAADVEVGSVKIVHVTVDRTTLAPIPLPQRIFLLAKTLS
jgi:1,4-dihydroxy-2-naphthoyl-CoA hydrolase